MTMASLQQRGAGRARWRLPPISAKGLILAAVAILVAYLTLPPIITVLYASFQSDFLGDDSRWTLMNYVSAVSDRANYGMFLNSMVYAAGVTVAATCVGAVQAWIYTRTDTPFKPFVFAAAMLPFVIPGILLSFAYIFLLSPQIGYLNALAKTFSGAAPFSIYSLPGMILVQTLHVTPIAFTMLSGVFASMDVTLEEAARASGADAAQTLRRVTARLALPGVISAGLLIFVQTVASFEVPNLIGEPGKIYVFVSAIFEDLHSYPSDYSGAATLGAIVMALSCCGIWLSTRVSRQSNRFVTVTGKGFKPKTTRLGRWRWASLGFMAICFLFAVALPVSMLLWVSFLPGYEVPSLAALTKLSLKNYATVLAYPRIGSALVNSLVVTISASAIVMAMTSLAAYISVKTRLPGRAILDGLIFVPIAIPGTIMGVSILFWYLMAPLPISIYGTLAIIVVGFVTLYLPYGMRFMTPAILQISHEMEEAALASGAGFARTLFSIYRPLLISPLIGGFLFIVILGFREISAAVFLYAQGTELFALAIYDMWGEGLFGYVSALGVLMICAFIPIVVVAQRMLNRGRST